MTGRHVFYEGRVQGVGFRYTVKRLAAGFEITGSVRNLADGRVELHISGEAEEADSFLAAIRESELGAHIRAEQISNGPAQRGLKGFEIIR